MRFYKEAPIVVLEREFLSPWLGIDDGVITAIEQSNLANLSASVQAWAESYLGFAVGSTTVRVFYDDWPEDGFFRLPVGGLVDWEHIDYNRRLDGTNDQVLASMFTTAPASQMVSELYPYLPNFQRSDFPELWPHTLGNRVRVTYYAGVGSWSQVDPRIRMAMLLKAKSWYMNRADSMLMSSQYPDVRTATELLDQVLRDTKS